MNIREGAGVKWGNGDRSRLEGDPLVNVSRTLHRLALTLLVGLPILLSRAPQVAAADWVTVKGEAAIIGGDLAAAKEAALLNAFRAAVERGVGTIIASDTLTQNYQVVDDRIFTKARGYVSKWNILNDFPRGDVYIVEVECLVSSENIRATLIEANILQEAKDHPRIMVLLATVHEELDILPPAAANAFMDVFVQNDFEVVDSQQVEAIRGRDVVLAALQGGDAALVELADQFGCEIVIRGDAKSVYAAKTYGLRSSTGMVSVRAIRTDTAKIIANASAESTKAHLDDRTAANQALQAAATQAAEETMQKILKRWAADVADSLRVQIQINGINFSQLSQFKRALGAMPGVKQVNQRNFVSGTAKLDIDFEGKTERLAELIDSSDVGFTPEILGLSQNRIEMRVGGM